MATPGTEAYVPATWTIEGLRAAGFEGFLPFASLSRAVVPTEPGWYVVLRPSTAPPTFIEASTAGRSRTATENVETLLHEWVDGAEALYIGLATWGSRKSGLWRRLRQYARTGVGSADNHFGGVWVWQLADAADLRVAWRVAGERGDESIKSVEHALIADLTRSYGRRPFANRRD